MPDSNPLVSVVILNYNGERFIRDCLDSVIADTYSPKEILLIDNASSDRSLAIAYDYQEQISIWPNEGNFGFPKGCNEGIRVARGDIIVLLNIDTIVQPGWLESLVKTIVDDESVGAAGSKLLFFDGETLQFAGGVMEANGLTKHIGHGECDEGQHDQPRECDYLTGASLAIRRDLLDKLGGLDEGFPLYFEDLDLSMRIHQRGYKTVYCPDSVVWHYETFGTKKESFKYFYKYHRGRLRLIFKQFGLRYFVQHFLPYELGWMTRCGLIRQGPPLLCAYFTQGIKSPFLWLIGFFTRRTLKQVY